MFHLSSDLGETGSAPSVRHGLMYGQNPCLLALSHGSVLSSPFVRTFVRQGDFTGLGFLGCSFNAAEYVHHVGLLPYEFKKDRCWFLALSLFRVSLKIQTFEKMHVLPPVR